MPTKFIVDSGSHNLVSRKYNYSLEVGFNLDYPLNNGWGVRTGIAVHLHYINETNYGVSGPIPPQVVGEGYQKWLPRFSGGANFLERASFGFPLQLQKRFRLNKTYSVNVFGGPFFNVYFGSKGEEINNTLLLDNPNGGNYIPLKEFRIVRDFYPNKKIKGLTITKPQIEWQLDVEMVRNFKKMGAIFLGLKGHLGVNNMERAEFTIWPTEPAYRAKGHYTLNRSYIGIYTGFRFGKNK
jgi:Outer membrane protein beta-barrel domain